LMLQDRWETTRQHVVSTLPHHQHHRKEGKRWGGMWFPCCLIINTTGRRGNDEAACGFHATLPGSGSSLVLIVLLSWLPPLFPSLLAFSDY
jgi:hypothetical protein